MADCAFSRGDFTSALSPPDGQRRKLKMRGAARGVGKEAGSSEYPTTIGAIAATPCGISSSDLTPAELSTAIALPTGQVPKPRSQAVSIRFSAASQQSASPYSLSILAQ